MGLIVRAYKGRFIPVLTGNTPENASRVLGPAVHPRAYGEHQIGLARWHRQRGSSPCLRGTQHDNLLQAHE